MKKFFVLALLMAVVMVPTMAQSVVRRGNTYMAEGTTMKKRAFADYMEAKAQAQFSSQFRSGLKVSDAGWGLFAAGLAGEMGGLIMSGAGSTKTVENAAANDGTVTEINPMVAGGAICYILGSACVTSGIVCLAVGYSRMHKSADLYASTKMQSQAYLSLKADKNGLGLALNF